MYRWVLYSIHLHDRSGALEIAALCTGDEMAEYDAAAVVNTQHSMSRLLGRCI